MRDVPFEPETQTLCRIFVMTLAGGERFAFSDHDRPLDFDGLVTKPMRATDTEGRTGFDADSGSLRAALDLDLSDEAIRDAALDGATLIEFRADWTDPTKHVLIAKGRIGAVTVTETGFEADWLGLATLLERSTGRVVSRRCDAELGDRRCGVDLSSLPDGTVCPRTFEACRDTFNNALNFRGFPYLVGDDVLQAGMDGTAQRDGGSRYG